MTTSTNGVSGALTSLATGGSDAALKNVNFDTFLKLLVTQLKNQDPLNPIDGTQFTSQIAQFSQLEQTINGNNYLSQLLDQQAYGQQTLAASFIGKDVLVPGDQIEKAASGDTTFGYAVTPAPAQDGGDGPAARDVKVSIYDSSGATVRTFDGDPTTGRHLVTWDGKDDNGNVLPAGSYTVGVSAADADGKVVASSAFALGKVDSVLLDGTNAYLSLTDGRQVGISDVMAVQNEAGVVSTVNSNGTTTPTTTGSTDTSGDSSGNGGTDTSADGGGDTTSDNS
ncbi:MAG: hypothetical protein GC129_03185 [Proteobacteria bacterium]|nr:hypothetical protein [Pseudomonadota bacterium]